MKNVFLSFHAILQIHLLHFISCLVLCVDRIADSRIVSHPYREYFSGKLLSVLFSISPTLGKVYSLRNGLLP